MVLSFGTVIDLESFHHPWWILVKAQLDLHTGRRCLGQMSKHCLLFAVSFSILESQAHEILEVDWSPCHLGPLGWLTTG